MTTLTRQDVIEQLQAAANHTINAQALARWAFDRFYAEEAGEIEYESGFRRVIVGVLDDLMFGDEPDFALTTAELHERITALTAAQPITDDDIEEDDDDADQEPS